MNFSQISLFILSKSWKTTVLGFIAAFLIIEPELEEALASGHADWRKLLLAFIVALLGRFAKDLDNPPKVDETKPNSGV